MKQCTEVTDKASPKPFVLLTLSDPKLIGQVIHIFLVAQQQQQQQQQQLFLINKLTICNASFLIAFSLREKK